MEITEIAETVSRARARWTVKDEPTRVLTDEELRRRCGYVPDHRALAMLRQRPEVPLESIAPGLMARAAATRPRVVDWRNYGGRNAITPIKDQGNCGSCVAFAVSALIESRVRMENGFTANLSEADLFFCGGRNCAGGWNPGPALTRAQDVGVPLERSFPYVDQDTPCTSASDRTQMSVRVGGQVAYLNAESRKVYLANVGPMVGCFDVYEDFNVYASGVYHHVTGAYRGGHCIQIIGYDDNDSCWICKNSWGTWWGDDGFFRIGYGECNIDSDGFLGVGGNPFYGTQGTILGSEIRPRDFVGRFASTKASSILRYRPAEYSWESIQIQSGSLSITEVGDTSGFGQLGDGRPFWTGDFTGDGYTDILFYYPGDKNWWLGKFNGATLNWTLAGNTAGFGQVADGRPFWTGDFTGDGHTDILFYYPGDKNWWLGQINGTTLKWKLAGNSTGFGQVWDGRPFWTGDFTGDGRSDVLFYYPGDRNWWLGRINGTTLTWTLVGNTDGFGQVWDGRPFWTGDFTGDGATDILFYYPGDCNWWLGHVSAGQLQWNLAGNTAGFGQVGDGRPFWTGDFTGDGKADLMFFFPGDANWWLGASQGAQFSWTLAGTTLQQPVWA
jgi:C1A family cysteine protease